MLNRTNLIWYAAGAGTYLLVLLGLLIASFNRPTPPVVKLEDATKEAIKQANKALDSVRGDRPEYESAWPLDGDLTQYLSKSFDGTARLLTLSHRKIKEGDLAKVSTLGDDLHVSFEKSDVPASELRHFKGMQVASMNFTQSSLDDEGLAELPLLGALPKLILNGARVTDKGMPHAVNVPGLRELHLKGTPVTDKGLESLAKAPWLEHLDLSGTRVLGMTFAKFSEHSTLQRLDVSHTQVGDDTLEHVLRFKLKDLNLEGTTVSDFGLEKVRGPFPRFLLLKNTRVTQRGVDALKKRLPAIGVDYGPPDPAQEEMDKAKKRIDDLKKGLPRL
jgi:hypothetical protein